MNIEKFLLLINIFSTLFMVGSIWLVQIVNYPLFSKLGSDFTTYHRYHVRLITYVVAVPMILEAFSTVLMLWFPYPGISKNLIWIGVILISIIWITTVFFSVPAHDQLAKGFQSNHFNKLLVSNWIRVLAWSFRSLILCLILIKILC